ncbi:MAG: flagellar hook-basal body complex protein FliE [Rhodobacteraceae bacterium]|nr:MAG: flagellar hook-basal body complex protein FliE [Paracoccaceae bacterium]|tara:strand:- start:2552 stop:2863 length:312 start_codon:yes stop_codon:yes gene_type:complete
MAEIGSLKLNLPNSTTSHIEKAEKIIGIQETNAFGDRISSAIKSVADSQSQSAQISKDFELGRETDLSKVMVQQQVSSLGFQLTLQVRNKLLSAYKDIMNMPV